MKQGMKCKRLVSQWPHIKGDHQKIEITKFPDGFLLNVFFSSGHARNGVVVNDLDHSSIAVDSSVKAIGKCAVHVFIYLFITINGIQFKIT